MARVQLPWRVLVRILPLIPQGLASRLWGRVARIELPRRLQGAVNRLFARMVGVDLAESERAPSRYASLAAFFSRNLREGARVWPVDRNVLCSPADGVLGAHGRVRDGRAVQAKGMDYSVADLLGSTAEGERFRGAVFLTVYLSPRHYHRVHAPCAASLHLARAIPGRLLPVAAPAVASVRDLFPRNERLVVVADGEHVEIAVVAVGAFNVGAISADFDPEWAGGSGGTVTNRARAREIRTKTYDPPLRLSPGDPLMTFHLGSTVILLIRPKEGPPLSLHPGLEEGEEIYAGTPVLRAIGP
jgi:phosphatidylserine decarboxylase